MNTLKKITLAALILGASAQTINAHPWTTKAIAATTLAGLGFGFGAVKYYGFNTITNSVLEKCANGKNWASDLIYNKIPSSIKNALFGSYMKQINDIKDARVKELQKGLETKKKLKTKLAQKDAQLVKSEADRKDAHERAISLTKQIIDKNATLIKMKTEKERIENTMRGTITGISGRSGILEIEKRAIITQNSKLQDEIAAQSQEIATLQETILQLQAQLAQLVPQAPSDVQTSDSSIASTDAEDVKADEGFELI